MTVSKISGLSAILSSTLKMNSPSRAQGVKNKFDNRKRTREGAFKKPVTFKCNVFMQRPYLLKTAAFGGVGS